MNDAIPGAGRRGAVTPPSGGQSDLRLGDQRAVVVLVGGAIREYENEGRAVLVPFPVDAMADGAHGTPLVPWPNRLDGGRYRFDGTDHQLALTEPEKGNAIHGLLRWRSWRPVELSTERVVLGDRIHPMPGYPFALDVVIDYQLGDAVSRSPRRRRTSATLRALPGSDKRLRGTINAISEELCHDGFVSRYSMTRKSEQVDGLPPGEATFLPCTLWLADSYLL